MNELALADDFQFDAQGFLMLRNVFDAERCRRYLEELERLFVRKYDDPWLHDGVRGQTTVQLTEGQRRINGLPLWTEVFDEGHQLCAGSGALAALDAASPARQHVGH